ncbi:MAG: hypothetical protein RXR20_25360 [Paraburkholderia sp.]|uniref:hypothetical protein n=1 Tax=Burkholderiaceae TaxID=119060 RepID=UPI0010F7B898|nr:hypothetical protein [Burkholderia sp. 4M9327F10]
MNTRTSLDKAALKFALQDRKKSQNVSVKSAWFFADFFGTFSLFNPLVEPIAGWQSRVAHAF